MTIKLMRTKLLHSYTCLPARQVARLLRKKQCNNISIYQSNNGFTLIELLVVIAIIGILAALATTNYTDSQKKSRDSRRKSDLTTIQKALELAKQDSPGNYSYPICRDTLVSTCIITTADTTSTNTDGTTNPDLIGTNYTYIKAIPVDPKTATGYTYNPTPATPCAVGTCTGFTLVACLENSKDPQKDPAASQNTTVCTVASGTVSYTITNL